MSMNLNVQQMAILIMLGVIGSAAVLPYSAALQSQMNLSLKIILLLLAQGLVLTAIAVFLDFGFAVAYHKSLVQCQWRGLITRCHRLYN